MGKKFNLYIVRHGQTYFNIFNKLQGWANSPLTKNGVAGAKVTGRKLANTKFAAAYCSDTTRAQVTLRIILNENRASHNVKPVSSKLFREEFYGYYEGGDVNNTWYLAGAPHGLPSFKAIVKKYSIGKAKDFLKEADPFHMAENNHDYWKRWDKAFQLIRSNPKIHDGDNVLLISHGNSVLSMVERFGNGKYDVTKRPANGSLTKLLVTDHGAKVTGYNIK